VLVRKEGFLPFLGFLPFSGQMGRRAHFGYNWQGFRVVPLPKRLRTSVVFLSELVFPNRNVSLSDGWDGDRLKWKERPGFLRPPSWRQEGEVGTGWDISCGLAAECVGCSQGQVLTKPTTKGFLFWRVTPETPEGQSSGLSRRLIRKGRFLAPGRTGEEIPEGEDGSEKEVLSSTGFRGSPLSRNKHILQ